MSVFDRFLNSIKLNDDDDLDDDEYFDDEDELDDSRPSRRFIDRREDEDIDDDPFEPVSRQSIPDPEPRRKKRSAQAPKDSKVSAFRPKRAGAVSEGSNNFSVCVIRPKSMEDALQIAQMLIAHCTIILNLEGLDLEVSQRIFDFASGACCASRGSLDKISNYIFVVTPHDVDITGEFQKILTGTFDPDVDLIDEL